MKFGITKYEKFALTSFLFGQQVANMEEGRKRLRAWEEFDVADLADALSMGATVGTDKIKPADWADNKKPLLVDINADIVEWAIQKLDGPKGGAVADTLTRLHPRLCDLRDKKYKLPEELREKKG